MKPAHHPDSPLQTVAALLSTAAIILLIAACIAHGAPPQLNPNPADPITPLYVTHLHLSITVYSDGTLTISPPSELTPDSARQLARQIELNNERSRAGWELVTAQLYHQAAQAQRDAAKAARQAAADNRKVAAAADKLLAAGYKICTHTDTKGTPCRRLTLQGQDYCTLHASKHAALGSPSNKPTKSVR